MGGFSSASSSISVRSFGRSSTQTLSSLSTARPVTPPIFHLFGRGLGQSGSSLNLGAVCSWAASDIHKTNRPRLANMTNARLDALLSLFMRPRKVRRWIYKANRAESSPQERACQQTTQRYDQWRTEELKRARVKGGRGCSVCGGVVWGS